MRVASDAPQMKRGPVKAPRTEPPLEETSLETIRGMSRQLYDEMQWVYATARAPLVDTETGERVAEEGSRILLVYPMQSDADTGRVTMRLKRIDAATGGISLHPIVIYSGDDEMDTRDGSVTRAVDSFSFVP